MVQSSNEWFILISTLFERNTKTNLKFLVRMFYLKCLLLYFVATFLPGQHSLWQALIDKRDPQSRAKPFSKVFQFLIRSSRNFSTYFWKCKSSGSVGAFNTYQLANNTNTQINIGTWQKLIPGDDSLYVRYVGT